MSSSKRTFFILTAGLLVALGAVSVIFVFGHGTNLDSSNLEDRLIARNKWLALIAKDGVSVFEDSVNATLLVCCFHEGETLIDCENLLATSKWQERYSPSGKEDEFDGAIEYYWEFTVKKPRQPDETRYVFYIRVQGKPATVKAVLGNLTVD